MIYLTGSTGFIGKTLLNYFKIYDVRVSSRGNEFNLEGSTIVVHLAGLAHDITNLTYASEYYNVNTELTKVLFDKFLDSEAKVFIILSSVKAVADAIDSELTEEQIPNPLTHYGKSKLLAEKYILSKEIPYGKRVYILRPSMIHGPENKGNFNLLYKFVITGLPWPLGAFENKRSYCSIDNLCFVINELIKNDQIESGIYNIADDDPISTNELVKLISESQGKNYLIWNIPKLLIRFISKLGDLFRLPLNTERLNKLTGTYNVSNKKIKKAINKQLPITSKDGLTKTFNSFINA